MQSIKQQKHGVNIDFKGVIKKLKRIRMHPETKQIQGSETTSLNQSIIMERKK